MTKTRLEAFSDGVIAIIITIMVLELKVPQSTDWETIKHLIPVFLSYVLSFIFLGIYWGNHHHLIHSIKGVNISILWANLHLLFWLSLVPFATAWMGESNFEKVPVIVYAVLADLCGIAYYILLMAITKHEAKNETMLKVLKKQSRKGFFSIIFYTAAIPVAFFHPAISCIIFTIVSLMWIIPDRNIERTVHNHPH
ncbi:MAG: DUF1211 domain-containing protein [Chitinophagaceae bacterium]|nr:DUF1211 domain-containing protein [Chitinophagaceae bacterium]